jgi:RAB protein geranylgeranyltransferase component A
MHQSPSPLGEVSQPHPARDAVILNPLDAGNTPDSSSSSSSVEKYDLVIKGTGLTESILAAAASWAGKKVLHVEKNTFYGSHWAALSIDQFDTWALENASEGFTYKDNRLTCVDGIPYNSAKFTRLPTSTLSNPSPLQTSRSYSLDLAPHLLYCSSDLVSCLANTKLSEYLEFKALEHIFILQKDQEQEVTLQKVPSSREDIFTSSLSLHDKRRLMKFLTYLLSIENAGKFSTE